MGHHSRPRFITWYAVCLSLICLLCLLASCGPGPRTTNEATATAQVSDQSTPTLTPDAHTPTPASLTNPVPDTQTACPVAENARPMVTASLLPGTHQTIVYSVNEGPFNDPTEAVLRRYDVTTGEKTDILSIPNVSFAHAQLSPDGQWVLFTATDKLGAIKLQMVRLDGQGLQTLYCTAAPGLDSLQWSPTQRFIAFTSGGPGNAERSVYLLDLASGALQVETSFAGSMPMLNVRTWPDNTRIYLTDRPINGQFTRLYLLDTNKGPHQPLSTLAVVAQGTFTDFDSAPDGSQLFLDAGGCSSGNCSTPSTITAMPIVGGTAHTVLASSSFSVEQVRAIGGGKLLLVIDKSASGQNGLWIMKTDGSGMLHLTTDDALHYSLLNPAGQYTWSNVSPDGSMYALLSGQPGGGNTAYTLLYGDLGGGAAIVFAQAPDGNNMLPTIVGWTMM